MRIMLLIVSALTSSAAVAAPTQSTFYHTSLQDVGGTVAGQCMNFGWTVTNQSSNEVTCQVPMNFGKQLLAEVLLGSRYSTQTAQYVQINFAQIGDDVRVQARSWLENQSAFGQVRQTPIEGRKVEGQLLTFLNGVGATIQQRSAAPAASQAQSHDDLVADNVRFVENMAQIGQCDAAKRFAEASTDEPVKARAAALCPSK